MSATHSLRWVRTLLAIVFIVTVTAQPTQAANDEPVWKLRVDLSWLDPSGDFVTTSVGGATVGTSFDTGFGGGLRGEYQFSPRLGVELGVLSIGSVDITSGVVGGAIGSGLEVSSFTPFTLGLNIHLAPDRRLDPYVGPLVAFVSYSDLDILTNIGNANTSVSVDNEVGWGVILGLDVPLGKRGWLIQTNLRYIETDMRDSGGVISIDSKFDPVVFSIGFGYRF